MYLQQCHSFLCSSASLIIYSGNVAHLFPEVVEKNGGGFMDLQCSSVHKSVSILH